MSIGNSLDIGRRGGRSGLGGGGEGLNKRNWKETLFALGVSRADLIACSKLQILPKCEELHFCFLTAFPTHLLINDEFQIISLRVNSIEHG